MASMVAPLCLICGQLLQPVALGPEHAPWLCNHCHRGFFHEELARRGYWRRYYRDFGHRGPVQAAVQVELVEAQVRGTSLRPDQLGLVPKEVLLALLAQRAPFIEPGFLKEIERALGFGAEGEGAEGEEAEGKGTEEIGDQGDRGERG
jgi:hypothetical protein